MSEDGEKKFRGTTLRSNYSMIKKYFTLIHKIDLDAIMPQIADRLREYEQEQPAIIQADTFTAEDIIKIIQLPDTPETVIYKFYMVIAKAMAGRGAEMFALEKKNVSDSLNC